MRRARPDPGAIVFADPIEAVVGEALMAAGIRFIHETEDKTACRGLDFYLPDLDLYIEVKRFHTARVAEQMSRVDNVIAIQGIGAARLLADLLAGRKPRPAPARERP